MTVHTGIAVALAIVIALGFLFLGPSLFTVEGTSDTSVPVPSSESMPSGLMITDDVIGTGAQAKTGDTLTVNYIGTLEDGTVFDQGTYSFKLGAGTVIAGWDQGLVGIQEGGRRVLVIPPSLGYGSQKYGPIPANATLIFTVELVKIGG